MPQYKVLLTVREDVEAVDSMDAMSKAISANCVGNSVIKASVEEVPYE